MKLSVVILNFNVRHFLQLCLSSVKQAIANLDAEIIVIDNNSSDDSCTMVKTHFPEIILIENNANVGFAKANNQAVAEAKGEYICILNPDTVVPENTFLKVLKFAATKEKLGIIGCQLVDGRGKYLEESKRNLPVLNVALKKQMGFSKTYYANQLDKDRTGPVPVLVGAFMFLKREVFNEVNGFDEEYFMYGEDIDLSYRIEQAGYQNWYVSECTVLHFKGESTLKDSTYAKRFYGAMKIFYKKHFKQNWFDNAMVNFGVKLAELIPQKTVEDEVQVERYVLISDRTYPELASKLKKPLKQVDALQHAHSNTEIILDANYLSFETILNYITNTQLNSKATFKIIPKNATFLIGSNQSISKGEIIQF